MSYLPDSLELAVPSMCDEASDGEFTPPTEVVKVESEEAEDALLVTPVDTQETTGIEPVTSQHFPISLNSNPYNEGESYKEILLLTSDDSPDNPLDNIISLESLFEEIKGNGYIDRNEAKRIDILTNGQLNQIIPINSFTSEPSTTNFNISMESSTNLLYGLYVAGALAVTYVAIKAINNVLTIAKGPEAKQYTTEILNSKPNKENKADHDRMLVKLANHVQSGAVRNKDLLDRVEENAKKKFPNFHINPQNNIDRYGKELVNRIFYNKIEKEHCLLWRGIILDSSMGTMLDNVGATFIAATDDIRTKLRNLKSELKSNSEIDFTKYMVDFEGFNRCATAFKFDLKADGGRQFGMEFNDALNELRIHQPGLPIPNISQCLDIKLNTNNMDRLDNSVFNSARAVTVLFEDIGRYASDYMKEGAERTKLLQFMDELDKEIKTLMNTYVVLINLRGKAASLVRKVRYSLNESRRTWGDISRDQNGRI